MGLLQPFLDEFISQRSPAHLIFLSTRESKIGLEQMLQSDEFKLRFGDCDAVYHHPSISHWSFLKSGRLTCEQIFSGECPTLDEECLIHDGLLTIFHSRVGLLEAPTNSHYVKPSGKHSAYFIRTGDVLVTDSETIFVASSIARILPKGSIQHILCDTSSIAVIGYALKSLALVKGSTRGGPRIHTFQSYKGIRDLSLNDADSTLFLISASTSGDLAKLIVEQTGITPKRVTTIFYRGINPSVGRVLCDVSRGGTHHKSVPEIGSFSGHNCHLCRQGRERIWILGDQFEARAAEAGLRLVTIEDRPKWLSRFNQEAHGKKIIFCHKVIRENDAPREFFFDLSKLFTSGSTEDFPRWGSKLENFLNQGVPASLKRIVYLADGASKLLGERVAKHLKDQQYRKQKIVIISAAELRKGSADLVLNDG